MHQIPLFMKLSPKLNDKLQRRADDLGLSSRQAYVKALIVAALEGGQK